MPPACDFTAQSHDEGSSHGRFALIPNTVGQAVTVRKYVKYRLPGSAECFRDTTSTSFATAPTR